MTDEWWRSKFLINGFNEACNNISDSYLKVGGESMSAIIIYTTSKGNLPHLSYIFYKPDTLGTELKKVSCSTTGEFIFVEL